MTSSSLTATSLAIRKRLLFASVLLLGMVLACEGFLRLAAAVSVSAAQVLGRAPAAAADAPPIEIPDPRFGTVPNPAFADHDAAGFRNASVLERADVVVLGDSQTYGAGVRRDEAWPQVMEQLTGRRTYQMAFGGFGPVHSLMLFAKAESLTPRTIVEAFYLGNDLYDAYTLVYARGQMPELRSQDPKVLSRLSDADKEETIEASVERHYARMVIGAQPPRETGAPGFLATHSYLFGLLRAVTTHPNWEALKASFRQHPEWDGVPFEAENLRTVFTPSYRLSALDIADPRLDEGLRISLEAIRQMSVLARERRVDYHVLVIPTKESAFWHGLTGRLQAGGERPRLVLGPQAMRALVTAENEVRARAIRSFEDNGIAWMDGREALAARVELGRQPYPITQDGHPNRDGYRALGELVAGALRQP